jgi:thiamine-phosphate pyrophosphorylase
MAIVASATHGLHAAGRATILQLRAPELTTRELERQATELVASSPIPVLVSSRCDVVLASGAAGVNLPERDILVGDARRLLEHRLVGRSVHSIEAALAAEGDGADFVIFGPVWASASHPGVEPVGVEALSDAARMLRIPVLAIGGLNEARIAECDAAGAAGYAAISLFR